MTPGYWKHLRVITDGERRRQRVKAPPNQLRRENMDGERFFGFLLAVAWWAVVFMFFMEVLE